MNKLLLIMLHDENFIECVEAPLGSFLNYYYENIDNIINTVIDTNEDYKIFNTLEKFKDFLILNIDSYFIIVTDEDMSLGIVESSGPHIFHRKSI